jgi:[ribosomal protein S5]-alanine N-acetyltransferase
MRVSETFKWGEKLPTLRSTGLILRALDGSDVTALYEIFSDPEVMRYWSSSPLDSIQAAANLLDKIHEGFADRRLFQWGIADSDNGTVIGTCTLLHFEHAHRRCEVGFALARKRWGRGEASRAVAAVLEFAFDVLDLHRLEADVDPRNSRSLRLLERLGFQREGVLRERYQVNGELQDTAFLGLLRSDWRTGSLSNLTLERT